MAFEIDLVTIFPGFFKGPLQESLLKRAQQEKLVKIRVHDLREYTHDKHKTVDDKPFGGGPGMVMKPEPIFECVEDLQKETPPGWVVLLDARGARFNQKRAAELAGKKRLILLCGHYEGIDHRVHDHLADELVSIGDFVTMGGGAPALCLIEAVTRLVPGVLGNEESLKEESHLEEGLEYPQYTRPRDFRGLAVPDVLVSGNHKEVEKWRREVSRAMTRKRKPD
jgi:tRNA (guanine37-N1)-methyltransferase